MTATEFPDESEPIISCDADGLKLRFDTKKPFEGNVYAKGYFNDPACRTVGQSHNGGYLNILFASPCAPRRRRTINPPGVVVEVNIVIMFHKQVLTKVDRSLKIECMYMQAEKTVSNAFDVSMLMSTEVNRNIPMPTCVYEVLDSGAVSGRPVKYAKIGDAVYHKWSCSGPAIEQYCMTVHSCYVDDGLGSATPLLDTSGCARDKYLLQSLDYINDTTAGKEAHVFKYADRASLYFNCQVKLALKETTCPRARCNEPSRLIRNVRDTPMLDEINMDVAYGGVTVFEILEQDTDLDLFRSNQLVSINDINSNFPWCFSTLSFAILIGGFCILSTMGVVAIVITIVKKIIKNSQSTDDKLSKVIDTLFGLNNNRF